MQLKLDSDFRDYGDEWFDLEGEVFPRRSTQGMSRPEMLTYLDEKGVTTAGHGWVKNMAHLLGPQTLTLGGKDHIYDGQDARKVVVYLDLHAHRGDGKILMTLAEAVKLYPDSYMSFYQDTDWNGSSVRHLQIGRQGFKIRYHSHDDWRSNYGEVDIEPARKFPASLEVCYIAREYPLFAIDYVKRQRDPVEPASMPYLVACDFNTAPGLRGTGIEDYLTGSEVVGLIKEWYGQKS